MKEMICIVCPRGCHLTVGDCPEFAVTGNACGRGAVYGRDEATAPKRVVTATCPLILPAEDESSGRIPRRVPVKTTGPVPKERVAELVSLLMKTRVALPVNLGDCIIENWDGSGVSVVVTRSIRS